jgi:primosomal protein N' (replication factor Y) (superfamily II helicase)
MSHAAFAQVAFALPLRQTFVYRVPDRLLGRVAPGVQVQAGFRGRTRRGFVLELMGETDVADPREIAAVLDDAALPSHLIELARWIADYYLAPIGEVLSTALPGGFEGFARSRARRGAVEDPIVSLAMPERVTLTAEQRAATRTIEEALGARRFTALLLHGVTASGKTEVYLRAARAARERGGQTLVLVPEVALGAQVLDAFERRFGGRVAALHSYLTVGERRRNWELARRGAVDVVVGARSAVFAPLPSLALVIVDEEHEPAYKQSEQLRYHGRDVAVRRAQMLEIPVVLGSATPSLESLANAARGKYATLRLPSRIDRRPLPAVRVVDLRRERASSATLSQPLAAAIRDRLAKREQVMLFLNRRGHFHHTQCRACGFVPRCRHCDISLTLHLEPAAWRCHYCDHHEPYVARCSQCGAAMLRFSGAGTQRVERELVAALPEARVLRVDTDVARKRGDPARLLRDFGSGRADVLIGTQMIAKGLDFPRVTLVGVLDADVALHLPDFRAAERTFQLLVQVAGRAGRGPSIGEVYVQTCTPEHPAIAAAIRHDAAAFLDHELRERRDVGYPPFTKLVALFFSAKDEDQVSRVSTTAADRLREEVGSGDIEVLGPAPQALARLRGLHRWHVLLKGIRGRPLREAARAELDRLTKEKGARTVRVIADVDPVEVL